MDGTAAISSNLEALKRILAGLVAMAGLGNRQSAIASRQSGQAADDPTSPIAYCRLPTAASPCPAISTAPYSGCCVQLNQPRGG
jgi:hypothetical protein